MTEKKRRLETFVISAVLLVPLLIMSAAGCTQEPATLIDDAGRQVTIGEAPQRIVSLAPSNTEILFTLGLADRVAAVTDYCNYPPEAKDKPSIGGFATPDIEQIATLAPDLVLATNIHKDEVVPALERLGLNVLVIDPKTIDEVLEAITMVGQSTDTEKEATRVVSAMTQRITAVTDKVASLTQTEKPKVFYVLWHDPLMTVSSTSRIHELIVKAGGINIAHDLSGDYPKISLEEVIFQNPDVIITGSGHGSSHDLPYQFAIGESRLQDITARQNGRIYEIDGDLTSRPGPRIVEGLEKLAQFIHPELFKEKK